MIDIAPGIINIEAVKTHNDKIQPYKKEICAFIQAPPVVMMLSRPQPPIVIATAGQHLQAMFCNIEYK